MKKATILAANLMALFILAGAVRAAEQEQIVIEDLSLSELRDQIEIVQAEFYRVFNSVNEDNKFDIICHKYMPTGSNISREACEPQFVIDKRADNVKESRNQNDTLMDHDALMASLQPEFRELTEKMNAVAAENQYFKELNQVLSMLNERLAEISK